MAWKIVGGTRVWVADTVSPRLATYAASIPVAKSPLATPTQAYIGNFRQVNPSTTLPDDSGTKVAAPVITEPIVTETTEVTPQGNYSNLSYSPIELPNLDIKLTAEQLDAILKNAQMYGDLGYDTGIAQIDLNKIQSDRYVDKFIADTNPEYWAKQRDTIAAAANATSSWLQNANAMGRLDTGEGGAMGDVGRVTGDIQAAGVEGVSLLEAELGKKIAETRLSSQNYKQDQDALKVGLQKEKGLAIAIKNLELQKEAIDTERQVVQQTFQNRLAQASDMREWEKINLQWQTFQRDTEFMYANLELEQAAAASGLETTRLQNEILKKSLSGGSGTSTTNKTAVNVPTTFAEWLALEKFNADKNGTTVDQSKVNNVNRFTYLNNLLAQGKELSEANLQEWEALAGWMKSEGLL